jgi:gamma-glutamyltranspeptidase/glutathione hydrolase
MLVKTSLLTSAALLAVAAPSSRQLAARDVITGGGSTKHGAVASEVGLCSEVGISILKAHGNAADAVSARGNVGPGRQVRIS